jgi:nucleotide-binding universal stress UspA family protein
MTADNPRPVLVAVGDDTVDSALEHGVAEAARAGCGVHLVHVLHVVATGAEMVLVDTTDVDRIARSTLRHALERAEDLAPEGMPVTGEVVSGAVVRSLVHAADDARLLVLQRRHLSRLERAVTRSVTNGVAAHAHVPVVSVPDGFDASARQGRPHLVVAGVDIPDRAAPVLGVALAASRARGATLKVVHTWSFPGAYDDIVMSRVEHDDWAERATKEIRAEIEKLGDQAEGVEVEVEARHHLAADALIEASRDADLLVVGRHDPVIPVGSHLGPVTKAVLRDAECPVLLANPRAREHHAWRRHRDETAD